MIATDIFDAVLRSDFIPDTIDSGWATLIGSFLSSLLAVLLFLTQRRIDIRDNRHRQQTQALATTKSVKYNLEIACKQFPRKNISTKSENKDFEYSSEDIRKVLHGIAAFSRILDENISDAEIRIQNLLNYDMLYGHQIDQIEALKIAFRKQARSIKELRRDIEERLHAPQPALSGYFHNLNC
ncbi:hypothetical protein [Thalassospira mesophila]|uniref:Uncharacterized protein n=1 Tax=Thalassospira mesophila TaxID=1293891 RepID=A0A1Y2L186_9PROT|nr:hypothetical protein [Thalassospira mesophila]OSQ38999.1 hypothetical protein TMES_09900 [Thalassospira mesophila]